MQGIFSETNIQTRLINIPSVMEMHKLCNSRNAKILSQLVNIINTTTAKFAECMRTICARIYFERAGQKVAYHHRHIIYNGGRRVRSGRESSRFRRTTST